MPPHLFLPRHIGHCWHLRNPLCPLPSICKRECNPLPPPCYSCASSPQSHSHSHFHPHSSWDQNRDQNRDREVPPAGATALPLPPQPSFAHATSMAAQFQLEAQEDAPALHQENVMAFSTQRFLVDNTQRYGKNLARSIFIPLSCASSSPHLPSRSLLKI